MAPRRSRRGGRKVRKMLRKRKSRTVNVNRALSPIPQRYITKMKYAGTVLTNDSGNYIFSINSLFDPDLSGGGHQPYGFDQLAALYNRYRVISCSWRVQVPKTDQAIQFGVIPGNSLSPTALTNFSHLKESPRARYVSQMPGGTAMTVSGKAYLPSIVGRTKAQYMADDRYQATTVASPEEDIQLFIKAASVIDVNLASAAVQVILEFTAEFFDVVTLSQSN